MASAPYFDRKLKDLAAEGARKIGESVAAVRTEFVKAGRLGSGAERHYVQQAIADELRGTLERMARWMIDAKLSERRDVLEAMRAVARNLTTRSIEGNAAALFGNLSTDSEGHTRRLIEMSAMSVKLIEMIDLVIDDAKTEIVGHSKHPSTESGAKVEAPGGQVNLIMGAPGATIQQGRDNLSQSSVIHLSVVTDLRTFVASVEAQASNLELDPSRHAELMAELQTIKAQLESPRPRSNMISACLTTVKNILEATTAQVVAHPLAQTAAEIARAIGLG